MMAGRLGSYERVVRVDDLTPGENIIDIKTYCIENHITPTCYLVTPPDADPTAAIATLAQSAMGGAITDRESIPVACYVWHPGSLQAIFRDSTTAGQVFIGGFNA